MAKVNNIRPGVDIPFADKVRTIYPVSLRQLRKLNETMRQMEVTENDDRSVDLMVEAACIILSSIEPELSEDPEAVEDLLDIKAFNQMIAAAMGTDPNV